MYTKLERNLYIKNERLHGMINLFKARRNKCFQSLPSSSWNRKGKKRIKVQKRQKKLGTDTATEQRLKNHQRF